jgi:hypothetical protein
MLHKNEFLSSHPDVHAGMDAYSVDGEKLGELERLDENSVTIEKGWFFPRDFTVRYDDIVDIREDRVVVSRSRKDLEGWQDEGYSGWDEYDRAKAEVHMETGRQTRREAGGKDETKTPVHMEVPTQKEDVKVERDEPRGKNE